MTPSGEKVTTKQQTAILALLSHPTIAAAAKACQISEETLYKWMKQPCFVAEYAVARRQAMTTGLSLLQKASGAAVATLVMLMQDKDTPSSSRVAAARSILEFAFKANELLDVETRLASLEAALAAQEGNPA
jgi:hypothetical protein